MRKLTRTVRSALLVAAALVVAPAVATANTITENFVLFSLGPISLLPPNCLAGLPCDLTVPVVVFTTTVPPFDPANGTLTEVDISLTGTLGWTNETTLTATLRCCVAFPGLFSTLFSEVFAPTPGTQGLTQIFGHVFGFSGSIVPISFNMAGMSTNPSVLADLSLGSPQSPFGPTFGLELDLIDNSPSSHSFLEFNGLPAGSSPLNGTVTFDFTPSAAVPEPSTWAMMLLGFAGLVFAFRQSRRKVSFAKIKTLEAA